MKCRGETIPFAVIATLNVPIIWRNSGHRKAILSIWKQQKQSSEVCYKKVVFRNFTKFTRKHLCQSLFFNKVASQISKNTFFIEHLRATAFYSTTKLALILILLSKSKKSHLVIKKKILPVIQFISMILQIIKSPDLQHLQLILDKSLSFNKDHIKTIQSNLNNFKLNLHPAVQNSKHW